MNRILSIKTPAENVKEYCFDAPLIARAARPGQFVIVIAREGGERVPFTICSSDSAAGSVTILVQEVGFTTKFMGTLGEGDSFFAVAGPLGKPTELEGYKRTALVGGGIGTAVIFPQAKYLRSLGREVDVIIGARNKSLILYEQEFRQLGVNLYIATDDGSYGVKGFVTQILKERLECGEIDAVFAVGPMPMMRATVATCVPFDLPVIVSMNSMMVDGTGMCGCCRVTVGGEVKYACVDGPEFDGRLVDFDEAIARSGIYRATEAEHMCRLTASKRGER